MKLIARIICIVLSVLMLLGVFGCAQQTDEPANDTVGETENGEAVTEAETEDPFYNDDLPELDFKDKSVKVLCYNHEAVKDEFYSEKMNGENVNDAVYTRNLLVQDRLHVKLEVVLNSAPHTALDNAVKGGDSEVCDVVSHATLNTIQSVQKGSYLNLNESEYIDTSKHYWSKSFNDMASFGTENKQYLATGEMAMSLFRYLFVTIYNRDEFENRKMTDLYEVVQNGEWTLDYQQALIQDTYVEKDGDDKMSTGDFFGLITGNTVSVDPYMVAARIALVTKNSDGEWESNCGEDTLSKTDELCEKVRRIYKDSNGTYVFKGAEQDDTGKTYIAQMFTDGNGLMATVQLYGLETTTVNAAFLYGIVPMPKLNTTQKDYATYVQDQVTSYGISATVDKGEKLDMASAFMECAASESHDTVVDAYYRKSMSYKYLQEANSVEMLNKIYDSIVFDFNSNFASIMGSFIFLLTARTMFTTNSGKQASSTISGGQKGMTKALTKFNGNMANMKY